MSIGALAGPAAAASGAGAGATLAAPAAASSMGIGTFGSALNGIAGKAANIAEGLTPGFMNGEIGQLGKLSQDLDAQRQKQFGSLQQFSSLK